MKINYFLRTLVIFLFFVCVLPGGLCFAKGWQAPLASSHKYAPSSQVQKDAPSSSLSSLQCLVRSPSTKCRPKSQVVPRISSTALEKKISSRSALVMDSDSGQILYSLRPDRAAQPASTIKILTGLLAIRALKDHELVSISRRAAEMPRSKIYLRRGKSYTADDLINAVLLSSANDASVALAEKIAGSEKDFARIMTYKAKELGANKTVCKSASGLTKRGQQSTVRDLALIFQQAMDDDEFARRIGKSKIRTREGKLLRNHNKALWRISGAEGGKTGYTRAARQTYVGQFSRGGDSIVVAIMGSETMWDDIHRLVDYGFARKQRLRLASQKNEESPMFTTSSLNLAKLISSAPSPGQPVLDDTKKKSKL